MTSLRLMSVAMTDVRTRAVLIVEPGYVYLSRLNLRGLLRSNVNGQNSLNIPKGKAKPEGESRQAGVVHHTKWTAQVVDSNLRHSFVYESNWGIPSDDLFSSKSARSRH
jgi:hypothetical protein